MLAWQSNQWVLGAAGATAGLCLLALNQPLVSRRNLHERLRELANRSLGPVENATAARIDEQETPTVQVEPGDLVGQMIQQGRCALMLRAQIASNLESVQLARAQDALDEAMAVVPAGPVLLRSRRQAEASDENPSSVGEQLVAVEGFFLDRFPVTNAQYQLFVNANGYEQMSLWDESIWPAVLGFVDQTGQGGPKFWHHGKHPAGKGDHPVVGVCWYEAAAYARWVGKRLPSDPEWVKAGSWPVCAAGGKPMQRKHPWGDAMNREIVNLWGSGHDNTIPVQATPASASVGGVQQLIGNVWEWTNSNFGIWEPANVRIETFSPMRSIRGGAFDTYFDSQAHCQFQSGECPLARKHNIGFRCALGFGDVASPEQASETTA
jgi:iron(II)-dependent oxidoreductase